MKATHIADLSSLQHHYLAAIIDGKRELSETEAIKRAQLLSLELSEGDYMVAVVAPYYLSIPVEKKDEAIEDCANYVWGQLEKEGYRCYCLVNSYDNVMILIMGMESGKTDNLEAAFIRIRKKLHARLSLDSFVGIGSLVNKLTDIYISANDANTMLSYKFTYAGQGVANIKPLVRFTHSPQYTSNIQFDRVIGCFQDGDIGKMARRLEELITSIRSKPNVLNTAIKRTFVELTVTILHTATNANVDTDQLLDGLDVYQWILEQNHTEVLTEWLLTLSENLIGKMMEAQETAEKKIIQSAITYIEEQLSNPQLGLQQVSEHVGLSPNYFSQMFKKEKGLGMNNYIAMQRVERAKFVLNSSDSRLSDVAAQCGFSSLAYFGQVFKKNTGMSPGEFRKIGRN